MATPIKSPLHKRAIGDVGEDLPEPDAPPCSQEGEACHSRVYSRPEPESTACDGPELSGPEPEAEPQELAPSVWDILLLNDERFDFESAELTYKACLDREDLNFELPAAVRENETEMNFEYTEGMEDTPSEGDAFPIPRSSDCDISGLTSVASGYQPSVAAATCLYLRQVRVDRLYSNSLGLLLNDTIVAGFDTAEAAGAGWHLGDKIVEVNGRQCRQHQEFQENFSKARAEGPPYVFTVLRGVDQQNAAQESAAAQEDVETTLRFVEISGMMQKRFGSRDAEMSRVCNQDSPSPSQLPWQGGSSSSSMLTNPYVMALTRRRSELENSAKGWSSFERGFREEDKNKLRVRQMELWELKQHAADQEDFDALGKLHKELQQLEAQLQRDVEEPLPCQLATQHGGTATLTPVRRPEKLRQSMLCDVDDVCCAGSGELELSAVELIAKELTKESSALGSRSGPARNVGIQRSTVICIDGGVPDLMRHTHRSSHLLDRAAPTTLHEPEANGSSSPGSPGSLFSELDSERACCRRKRNIAVQVRDEMARVGHDARLQPGQASIVCV